MKRPIDEGDFYETDEQAEKREMQDWLEKFKNAWHFGNRDKSALEVGEAYRICEKISQIVGFWDKPSC